MKPNVSYWAFLILLLSGTLLLHQLSHGEPKLPAHPLSEFPMQVAGWSGSEMGLEGRIIDALGVTDYINRVYRNTSAPPIGLYIGFYQSQRTGATIHSPKNCLPGGGWAPVQNRTIEIQRPGGKPATVNLYVIQKGLEKQIVLYWYQAHGRVIASEYSGKLYLVVDAIRLNRTDATIVRVTTPFVGDDQPAIERATLFAQQIIDKVDTAVPL